MTTKAGDGAHHRHDDDDDHHHHHHHHHHGSRPPPLPFHLLEVTVVSAQDLFAASRAMRTYAVAWMHPDHKLRTRLDRVGHTDPSWNDKFVFRVAPSFIRSDTSSITVEIYASQRSPLRDSLVGTARLVLSALHPTAATRYVALQVRRPASLRPQGILNLGVALLDSYARSATLLYADLPPNAAAVAGAEHDDDPRSASVAAMEMQLLRWRAQLPPPSHEHEKKKERRAHRAGGSHEKERREQRSDSQDKAKHRGEKRRLDERMRRSFGRLACFGGGGQWVQESGFHY